MRFVVLVQFVTVVVVTVFVLGYLYFGPLYRLAMPFLLGIIITLLKKMFLNATSKPQLPVSRD